MPVDVFCSVTVDSFHPYLRIFFSEPLGQFLDETSLYCLAASR